ncbi:MAG: LysM peptidoglycan-binding domain-containing protein [Candidatus Kapabacteria bacterium]|nr:LysM peptidoglycan-binding domain-containing protein [Candidatus Kapabacteria bacterium]
MKSVLILVVASVVVASLASCGGSKPIPAPDSKPDSLLTFDEANLRLEDWRIKVAKLNSRDSSLGADIKLLEDKLTAEIAALKKCNEDIYALVGATEADVNNFGERLGRLEGKIRELRSLPDDQFEQRRNEVYALAAEWNALRAMKMSVLPQFFERVVQARRDIDGLFNRKVVPKNKGYVVRSWSEYKDCLWNIAGQQEIYGDPFQWTKIWQSNTNIIRNPDMIQPGMELTVPPPGPKTTDEQKAERMYWRRKRAAAAAAAAKVSEGLTAPPSTPAAPAPPPPPPAPVKKDERGEKKGN